MVLAPELVKNIVYKEVLLSFLLTIFEIHSFTKTQIYHERNRGQSVIIITGVVHFVIKYQSY